MTNGTASQGSSSQRSSPRAADGVAAHYGTSTPAASGGEGGGPGVTVTVDVAMTVNGKSVRGRVEPRTLLVQFLREQLRLTGTHVGCDTSQCGACVVHIDGQAVKACTVLAVQSQGRDVLTVEGLAGDGALHPMQEAFREHHGLQCGYCTPGMIMTAIDIVRRKGHALDETTIRHELEGNICRCTGYHNIVKAVAAGAAAMGSAAGSAAGGASTSTPLPQAAE